MLKSVPEYIKGLSIEHPQWTISQRRLGAMMDKIAKLQGQPVHIGHKEEWRLKGSRDILMKRTRQRAQRIADRDRSQIVYHSLI